jgi:outer membrane protein, multidrug efflux system
MHMPGASPVPTPSMHCAMSRRSAGCNATVRVQGVLAAVLGLAVSSCATPIPQALTSQMVPRSFEGPETPSTKPWAEATWWDGFGDPDLTALIMRAQAENRDLAVAVARIMQSQAQVAVQRAVLFPQIGAQANRANSGCNGGSCLDFAGSRSVGLTFNATYELDFWGAARDNLQAAKELLKSARFSKQSVELTVTANVAEQYFEVLATRRRIAIANDFLVAVNGLLENIKLHVKAGAASRLDVAREEAQLEAVSALLPGLETEERQALFTLALLLGQPPEGFDVSARSLDGVRTPEVAAGLPSDLLLRRPDVAQAEANLAGAHANVDAARAAFLPQMSLTASGGFVSSAIGALVQRSNFGYSYGATLLQTIFDGGRLKGQRNLAEGVQQEFIASYQNAVLHAFADVETALVQVANTRRAEEHLGREEEAAREAFGISQLQYREGTADLLAVLQAQQTLYLAQDQRAQTALDNARAIVHLYEALGGGWMEDPNDRTQVLEIRQ